MVRDDLWKRRDVRFKDIPTLQELLAACDSDLFARVVIDGFACRAKRCGPPDGKRRRAMERRIASSLDAMCSLRAPDRKKCHRLLVPAESYSLIARSNTIARHLDAALIVPTDAADARLVLAALGNPATGFDQVKKAQKRLRALERKRAAAGEARPTAVLEQRPSALAPWEETLGDRVWLGGPWCRRERYLVLASAFWEMTYYGFAYDQVLARQAQEKAKLLAGAGGKARGGHARDAHAYGLAEPDRFELRYRERLAQTIAVLNHNANREFCERLIDLADRLEKR